jgi:hypothetical protein
MKLYRLAFICSLSLSVATTINGQITPIIITTKAAEPNANTKPVEPNFVGNQIAFDDVLNQVTFKEKAGFKTDKIEVVNAEAVIFNKKDMTFKVYNAEKIFTGIKVIRNKTSDKTKACVEYKLNDDTLYITEYSK